MSKPTHDAHPPRFGRRKTTRREDDRLVRGLGQYTADLFSKNQLVAKFLRAEHAHANFEIASTEDARDLPGVHLVWTADDLPMTGFLPLVALPTVAEGTEIRACPQPLMCAGRVRRMGEVIAMVVAETEHQAQDALEAIDVRYDTLPSVTEVRMASEETSPIIWPDNGTNLAFSSTFGDAEATNAAFAGAAHVARVSVTHNRLVSNYLEPRAALAEWDRTTKNWTMMLPSQGAHALRNAIARSMAIDPSRLRVVTGDVGGGFGPKYFAYQEYPLLAFAARALDRAVNWTSSRMEHFVADAHGRDAVVDAELAIDGQGKILALRSRWDAGLGAYMSQHGSYVPWIGATMSVGVYDIPACHVTLRGYYTNTTPTDAYRGAGRPEAALTIERLVDEGARVAGLDPTEFRKRNFIRSSQMPYTTPTGQTYDTGDFEGHLQTAMGAAHYATFNRRLANSAARGKLRGIGFAVYIEACAFPSSETVRLSLDSDGRIVLDAGTQSTGQGHETVFADAVAGELGILPEQVRVRQGDTHHLESARGTSGSRSIPYSLPAIRVAGRNFIEQIRQEAARQFGVAANEVTVDKTGVMVAGTNHSKSFASLAEDAADLDALAVFGRVSHSGSSFPNGTHVCEVEIDPETGAVEVLSLVVVDDFGVVLNPTLLDGQIHGGVAQGLGQALLEQVVYDESGQLLTASFMDYAMPRATDMPRFDLHTRNVPSTNNEMGFKGGGEAGAIGATPAIANAVINALYREYGITDIACPTTPERIWQAIQAATRGQTCKVD